MNEVLGIVYTYQSDINCKGTLLLVFKHQDFDKGMSPLGHPNFSKEGSYGCFKDGLGPRLWSKLVMKKLPHARAAWTGLGLGP